MAARFVRLAISGFKSFAEPASLEILPGLTGVVGPNGCGKSNVAEALRWAMGESNARSLRGGDMDDVIFAGTVHRPSRNLAEVTLHLESSDGELPLPYAMQSDLQIVRRIERGGGSTFRVNGREVRARDVQTLFADLATGARSSAMVSQGRVGTLVNARPEDRRAVLEEAAGITGLHARRSEAETRLRAAEANLERAEERRALLMTQLTGLQEQARQAARYRIVADALLETEAALLAMQRARATAERERAAAALVAAQAEMRLLADAMRVAARAVDSIQAGLPALRDAEAQTRNQVDRARLTQENLAAEAARMAAAHQASGHRRQQLARDLQHARSVLGDAENADARLDAEASTLRTGSTSHPAALEAAQTEAVTAGIALSEADRRANLASTAAAEASALSAALRHTLDQARSRARRADDAHARLSVDCSRAESQIVPHPVLNAAAQSMAEADQAFAAAREEQDRADLTRTEATPQATTAREAYARTDAQRQKLSAQVAAIAELLAVVDGERWTPMVDRLTVEPGLEAALGAALGDSLAAADDPAAARHWRAMPPLTVTPLPGRRLSTLVEAPPLLERALGGVAVVDSDDEGDRLQGQLGPGQSLVSRDGAVWRWDGYAIRSGTPSQAAVRLQQRNQLAERRLRLVDAEAESRTARERRDASDRAEREAVAADTAARTARRDAEARTEQARAATATLRATAQAASTRLEGLHAELARLTPERDAASSALAEAQQAEAAQPDPASLTAAASAARGDVQAARSRESAATRALDSIVLAERTRTTRLDVIIREREDRLLRVADLAARVTDLSARAQEAEADYARLGALPARSHAALEADAALAASIAAADGAVAARRRAEADAEVAANTSRAAEHAVFAVRETIVRAELAEQAASQAMDEACMRIAEREGALPPMPIVADTSIADEEKARSRMIRLGRERDQMGPVNLRAEIEADALQADVTTIAREREELETAIAKLRGSIGHLNREGRERLSAIFQQVDRHFQTLFARMFGGGRAHLALVGSDDPLQAGLEIYAQPPGKKLAALSLLSGGEQALTALSLIFAVFRCNPAPLCVLDEVDAPLDDANVGRFCTLLAEMVQEAGTRFLVVTHHQLTMARMDRLYGVTMQERGVSRLLSVDLSRARGMIEAVAAE